MPDITLNWTDPEKFDLVRDYDPFSGMIAVYHLYSDEVFYPYPRNSREVTGANHIFYFGGTADLGGELAGYKNDTSETIKRQLARRKSLVFSYAPLSYAEIAQRPDDKHRVKSFSLEDYATSVAALLCAVFERQYETPPLCNVDPLEAKVGNIALIQNVDVIRELDTEPVGY